MSDDAKESVPLPNDCFLHIVVGGLIDHYKHIKKDKKIPKKVNLPIAVFTMCKKTRILEGFPLKKGCDQNYKRKEKNIFHCKLLPIDFAL